MAQMEDISIKRPSGSSRGWLEYSKPNHAICDAVSVVLYGKPQEFMEASSAGGIERGTPIPVRRKSRKKSVDRRASKGRKIKYVAHPKMQNFMFPRVSGGF